MLKDYSNDMQDMTSQISNHSDGKEKRWREQLSLKQTFVNKQRMWLVISNMYAD